MGLADNIAAVRGDVSTHAMAVFTEFFKKFPAHQNVFPDYKGKDVDSLKSMPKFKTHTTNVVNRLLEVLEKAGDASANAANGAALAKMPQHKTIGKQQYVDLAAVLVPYLQKTLGSACATAEWEAAYNAVVSAIVAAQ